MDPESLAAAQSRQKRRINTIRSQQVEHVVGHRLRALGLLLVEQIATPTKALRVQGKVVGIRYVGRVSGDYRAITATGRSVLVEIKRREARTLAPSDLEPHQRRALEIHAAAGGLSLLVWSHPPELFVLSFPIPGWNADAFTALTAERAAQLHLTAIPTT